MPTRKERLKALAEHPDFRVGAYVVQPGQLIVIKDDVEYHLEIRKMEVLAMLADHADTFVSKDDLLRKIWGVDKQGDTIHNDGAVEAVISHLRNFFGDKKRAPCYIETRAGGYKLIAKVVSDNGGERPTQQQAWLGRNPYVGLEAFDHKHADVFFGRSRLTKRLRDAMRKQIDNERRFVFMVGPSGCGKTSLLRAGVLPKIEDGVIDGLEALSIATCNMAAAQGGDVVEQLSMALSRWELRGSAVFKWSSARDLANHLIQHADSIASTISGAFDCYADRRLSYKPYAHLLLVIDHAESLVSSNKISQEERGDFSRVINALCECPRVLAVMIARSDYPTLIESMPDIAERIAGEGHIQVLTPSSNEIREIIRYPAEIAGLSFEHDGQSLDDVLRDAAVEHLDALPLLQHTLKLLYDDRTENRMLTFAGYQKIGGLEGAIAHHAEEVFSALPLTAKDSLDRVLSHLVVANPANDAIITTRVVKRAALPDEGAQTLIDAFISARLFVGKYSDDQQAFDVVHTALLRQWPTAKNWVRDNRRFLLAREDFQRTANIWSSKGRPEDLLLNSTTQLSEADEVFQKLPENMNSDIRDFIYASRRLLMRKRRLRRSAIVAMAFLTLFSATAGLITLVERQKAEKRREETQEFANYLLGGLTTKLDLSGNLELLESVSMKALSYYQSQPESELRTNDLINYSRAFRILGSVKLSQKKYTHALTLFALSAQKSGKAVDSNYSSQEALNELAQATYYLGNHHYELKNYRKAEIQWNNYLKIERLLIKMAPANDIWKTEEAYALNNLGSLALRQGRPESALAFFRGSEQHKRRMKERYKDDLSMSYDWIDSLSWISSSLEASGKLEEAAKGYYEQIRLLGELTDKKKDYHKWNFRLANFLQLQATLETSMGNLKQARDSAKKSVDILYRLSKIEPYNDDWMQSLARGRLILADIARLQSDHNTEYEQLQLALKTISEIDDEIRLTEAWKSIEINANFMTTQRNRQLFYFKNDNTKIYDIPAHSLEFNSDETWIQYAKILIANGYFHSKAGRREVANDSWRQAILALEKVSAKTRPDWNHHWIEANILLGMRHNTLHRILWLQTIGYRHPDFIKIQE
ncbi:MAG: winged helix-turn-helix domain-containing protein [Xanthomonadales bacterium]|nr:winged helix-turn-helix domain-containing protein [Xanthomonadales bacterium]